jgi:hypothetical protein
VGGAGLTVVPIMVSCVFWLAGAYRPEALDDSILQLLYDTAWLLIDMGYMVTTVQMVAMGVAFLNDRRAVPLVPKWLGPGTASGSASASSPKYSCRSSRAASSRAAVRSISGSSSSCGSSGSCS